MVSLEIQHALLTAVGKQTFEKQRLRAGARTVAQRVEDQKALLSCSLLRMLTNLIQSEVDDLLAEPVVGTHGVFRCIFVPGNDLIRIERLAGDRRMDLVDQGRFELDEDRM
jgi:hypothetical protein